MRTRVTYLILLTISVLHGANLPLPKWGTTTYELDSGLFGGPTETPAPRAKEIIEKKPTPSPTKIAESPIKEKAITPPMEVTKKVPTPMVSTPPEVITPTKPITPNTPPFTLVKHLTTKPNQFLLNPQNLLTEPQAEEILRFLEYHSEESIIDIFALVANKPQLSSITQNDLDSLADQWGRERRTVIFAFELDNINSTRMGVSKSITNYLARSEFESIRRDTIQIAKEVSDPFNQIDRFCINYSHLIYWVEKTEIERVAKLEEILEEERIENLGLKVSTVTDQPALTTKQKLESNLNKLPKEAIWIISGSLLPLSLFLFNFFRKKKIKNDRDQYYFPNIGILKRLGAPYSGGNGNAIIFKNNKV